MLHEKIQRHVAGVELVRAVECLEGKAVGNLQLAVDLPGGRSHLPGGGDVEQLVAAARLQIKRARANQRPAMERGA